MDPSYLKTGVKLLVEASVGSVVAGVIRNNVNREGRLRKIWTGIGGYAISTTVATLIRQATDEKIDSAIDKALGFVQSVKKEGK